MTLMELTNHEAGIVVWENGDVIVANWGNADDDQIPYLSPVGGLVINWTVDGVFEGVKEERITNILEHLPEEMTVLLDDNNDIPRLLSYPEKDRFGMVPDLEGYCYTLKDGIKIYVLDDWN